MALWRWCAFRNRTGEMLPGSVTQSARSAPSDGGGHPRVVNAAGVTRWPQSLRLSPRLPPGLRGRPESSRGAGRSPQLGPAGLLSTAGLWRLRGFQRRLRGKSRRAGVVLVCAEGACALVWGQPEPSASGFSHDSWRLLAFTSRGCRLTSA